MKTDILIIGGGLTARRAASIAAKKYRVILISDGAELFLRDTLKSGKEQNDPRLVKALCDGSLAIGEELSKRLDRTEDGEFVLLKPLGSSVPRVAGIGGRTGAVLLSELAKKKEYTELSNTRALSLIKSGCEVCGATVFDKERRVHFPIYARAVLVATGGFGGIFRFSTNSSDIGGDGAAMLYRAGAELVDMEFIQYEPTVAVSPAPLIGKSIITTMLFEGAVIRNARGERFMDEQVEKDALSEGISREIAGGGTKNGGVLYDMTAVPTELLNGKYRDYYQRYARCGIDIERTPVEIAPAPHTPMGGALINEHTETAVPRLFVAGEAAGGVHGANRLGGNAGLEVLVFGDIAGKTLLRFLDEKPDNPAFANALWAEELPDEPFDCAALQEELYTVCDTALGIVRCGERLKEALTALDSIIYKTEGRPRSFQAMRLYNDALTIKLSVAAALERTESVGSHVRSDPSGCSEEKYRIVLKNEENRLTIKRQAIK